MADETTATTETTEAAADQTTATETTETNSTAAEAGATETAGDTTDTTALGKAPEKTEEAAALPEVLGAPEGDYEITAPEGRAFDKEAFDAVAPVLKEMNLSNKGAQQVVAAYADKVLPLIEQRMSAQLAEQQQLQTAEYRKTWLAESQKDPEIGGAKWDESLAIAGKVFDAVGMKQADPFRTLLEESGLGNHPDAIRFMRRVGTLIGEDKFHRGEGDSSADSRPVWDRVYGGPTTTETART